MNMERIDIKGLKNSPRVVLDKDKNEFEISGISIPEDAMGFFEKLMLWADEYQKNPNAESIIKVQVEYMNTSSTKLLFMFLCKFEELVKKSVSKVSIDWYYEEDDEDMLKIGRDFEASLAMPFRLIETEEQ